MSSDFEDPLAIIAQFQKIPPVNVEGIAQAMGLPVYRQDLGISVSAKIKRDKIRGGRSGFAIFIHANDAPVRQRFSLAHEIAHYVLHRDLIDDGVTDDTLYRSSELNGYFETQANRLAADILMPVRLVKQAATVTNSLTALSMQFEVSKPSMKIRLESLRIPYAT